MSRRWWRALGAAFVVALTFGVHGGGQASAHPQGNLTVNTSARLVIAPEALRVEYVVDLAELPTVQERRALAEAGSDAAYATATCARLFGAVSVTADGEPMSLVAGMSSVARLPGDGGLDTLRLECAAVGGAVADGAALAWRDTNFVDRLGWREVVVAADGVTLTTDLPTVSGSDTLRSYPSGVEAPRVLEATVDVAHGGPRLAGSSDAGAPVSGSPAGEATTIDRGGDGLTRYFNRLVGDRDLTLGLALVAAGVAFLLGAMHSLAPGHGKTLMAAMVASRRGTVRQVMGMGATVALTHTLGVVVLGLVITTTQTVAPDRVLPYLTVASGAMLLATGAWLLLRRAVTGSSGHGLHHHGHHDHHGYGHGFGHHHHGPVGDHDHGHDHGPEPACTRPLALLGVAGGLVPTPSALVVLLGATALGRAWFGVVLVGVYGIGMAATLLAAGVLLVRLQGWLERQYADARWLTLTMRLLPVATAALLILGGLSLAVRGATAI